MESPIPKPVIAKKDNDDKDNNNDNCEAPPSIVQSQVINQSQYSKDNNISSINIGMSELNINPSYNDALEDSSNVKLRSTPNHQEIVNQNNISNINNKDQEKLPQLQEKINNMNDQYNNQYDSNNHYYNYPYNPNEQGNLNDEKQENNNINNANPNTYSNQNQNPYDWNNGPQSQFRKFGQFGPHGISGFHNNFPYGPQGHFFPHDHYFNIPHGPYPPQHLNQKNESNENPNPSNNEQYQDKNEYHWDGPHGPPHFWDPHGPHFWEHFHGPPPFWAHHHGHHFPHGHHFHHGPHGPDDPNRPHFPHGPHEHSPHGHGPHFPHMHGPHFHHQHSTHGLPPPTQTPETQVNKNNEKKKNN